MSKILMLCLVTVLFSLPISFVVVVAQPDVESDDGKKDDDSISQFLIPGISAVVSAAVTMATLYIRPKIETKLHIRNLYDEPFRNWCVQLHGTIREFKELCDEVRVKKSLLDPHPRKRLNPTFVITHLWEMHKEAEEGYKWLGIIEKAEKYDDLSEEHRKQSAYKNLNDLFDSIDKLWHYLENEYCDLIDNSNPSTRLTVLHNLKSDVKQQIAQKIVSQIVADDILNENTFSRINDFLKDRLPED